MKLRCQVFGHRDFPGNSGLQVCIRCGIRQADLLKTVGELEQEWREKNKNPALQEKRKRRWWWVIEWIREVLK